MSDSVVAGALVHLFDAAVRFTSESPDDAVVPPDGREGVYLGSGDGVATGERLRGRLRWSFYSGNCLYPQIRRGAAVPARGVTVPGGDVAWGRGATGPEGNVFSSAMARPARQASAASSARIPLCRR